MAGLVSLNAPPEIFNVDPTSVTVVGPVNDPVKRRLPGRMPEPRMLPFISIEPPLLKIQVPNGSGVDDVKLPVWKFSRQPTQAKDPPGVAVTTSTVIPVPNKGGPLTPPYEMVPPVGVLMLKIKRWSGQHRGRR